MSLPTFTEFPKITRFARTAIVTEKIDGTNAQIWISDDGSQIAAGSRTRWITPADDNFGFARWVEANKTELLKLGPGSHFGEWWGAGIQRRYGMTEKRFSLFNVTRWAAERPACCDVVPILWSGSLADLPVYRVLEALSKDGSKAAPGFMQPEGIVVFHEPSHALFKMTLDKNDGHKGI